MNVFFFVFYFKFSRNKLILKKDIFLNVKYSLKLKKKLFKKKKFWLNVILKENRKKKMGLSYFFCEKKRYEKYLCNQKVANFTHVRVCAVAIAILRNK